MAENKPKNHSESDNLCVVCFKPVEIFSIGCCEHAVCFECSTRMRVLCKQNECPICRRELPRVIFTKMIEPFSALFRRFERSNLQDRKVGIIHSTFEIQKAYARLLEHRCLICDDNEHCWPFKTFNQLKDHMRREHELFFCDICTENVKIFSFERKCYTRQDLAHHRRKGDKDNTSHRGHPLCEFCDTRFMDSDELFRHLRRNHLFCHFCDADGKHQYYNTMDDLKGHFRQEHFLCEEGECRAMPLTAVFRTDIDLKAHITQEHGRYMSKSGAKQARTLELEFTLAPRPRPENVRNRRSNNDRRERVYEEDASNYNFEPGGLPPADGPDPHSHMFVNTIKSEDFPVLGHGGSTSGVNVNLATSKNYTKFSNAAFNSDDFPSLGGKPAANSSRVTSAPAVTITTNAGSSNPKGRAPEVTISRTVRNKQGGQKKENFPALGDPSSTGSSSVRLSVNSSQDSKSPKVSIQVNKISNGAITTHITTSTSSNTQSRPQNNQNRAQTNQTRASEMFPSLGKPAEMFPSLGKPTEMFPSLGKSSKPSEAKWVQPKPKNAEETKLKKVAPCPDLPPSDMSSFPSLSKGKSDKKKTSSVTVPVNNWVNLNSLNSAAKSVNSNENKSKKQGETVSNNNNSDKKTDNNKTDVNNAVVLDFELDKLKLVDVSDKKAKEKKKKNKNITENHVNNDNSNKEQKNVENSVITEDSNNIKNGVVKKKSELKIGTLSNMSNDFPSLGGGEGAQRPAPPPGFSVNVKPPPGFVNADFPSLSSSNDLTFTNSSGQSYSIIPTINSDYRQPQNFQTRNQNLIKKFMSVLNDYQTINDFKTMSDHFRKGTVESKDYYKHCKKVLGTNFDSIYPELLVLLPDISKQQELFQLLDKKTKENLVTCENCKQVVMKKELSDHYNYHRLENHFPSLGTAQQQNNAWKN